MKRPSFNASALTQSRTGGPTNNTAITAVDDKGNTQDINISPKAKDQLLQMLLAAMPFGTAEQDAKSTKNFLLAKNTRVFEGPDGIIGLEVLLGPNIAIHILLPGLLPEALEQQLHQFRSSSPSQPH